METRKNTIRMGYDLINIYKNKVIEINSATGAYRVISLLCTASEFMQVFSRQINQDTNIIEHIRPD
jgi:hypothetical protein